MGEVRPALSDFWARLDSRRSALLLFHPESSSSTPIRSVFNCFHLKRRSIEKMPFRSFKCPVPVLWTLSKEESPCAPTPACTEDLTHEPSCTSIGQRQCVRNNAQCCRRLIRKVKISEPSSLPALQTALRTHSCHFVAPQRALTLGPILAKGIVANHPLPLLLLGECDQQRCPGHHQFRRGLAKQASAELMLTHEKPKCLCQIDGGSYKTTSSNPRLSEVWRS